jgi:hypothetical protein
VPHILKDLKMVKPMLPYLVLQLSRVKTANIGGLVCNSDGNFTPCPPLGPINQLVHVALDLIVLSGIRSLFRGGRFGLSTWGENHWIAARRAKFAAGEYFFPLWLHRCAPLRQMRAISHAGWLKEQYKHKNGKYI